MPFTLLNIQVCLYWDVALTLDAEFQTNPKIEVPSSSGYKKPDKALRNVSNY